MSITFRCPRCGKRMTVEDRFGGQAGPCAHCGEEIAIPLPARLAPGLGGSPTVLLLTIAGAGLIGLVLCMGIGGMLYSAWQTLAR
jgi:uncharacterized protein (DUF983 family)